MERVMTGIEIGYVNIADGHEAVDTGRRKREREEVRQEAKIDRSGFDGWLDPDNLYG